MQGGSKTRRHLDGLLHTLTLTPFQSESQPPPRQWQNPIQAQATPFAAAALIPAPGRAQSESTPPGRAGQSKSSPHTGDGDLNHHGGGHARQSKSTAAADTSAHAGPARSTRTDPQVQLEPAQARPSLGTCDLKYEGGDALAARQSDPPPIRVTTATVRIRGPGLEPAATGGLIRSLASDSDLRRFRRALRVKTSESGLQLPPMGGGGPTRSTPHRAAAEIGADPTH